VKRGAGQGEIDIMKRSFCAEGVWPDDVGGDYLVNLIYYALQQWRFRWGENRFDFFFRASSLAFSARSVFNNSSAG